MAKELVDFVFKIDTTSADKALKTLSDKFAALGKGSKINIGEIDVQSVIDSITIVQKKLQELGDSSTSGNFQSFSKVISDSLLQIQTIVDRLDISVPFQDATEHIENIVKNINAVTKALQALKNVDIEIALPTTDVNSFVQSLDKAVELATKLSTVLSSLPTVSAVPSTATSATPTLSPVEQSSTVTIPELSIPSGSSAPSESFDLSPVVSTIQSSADIVSNEIVSAADVVTDRLDALADTTETSTINESINALIPEIQKGSSDIVAKLDNISIAPQNNAQESVTTTLPEANGSGGSESEGDESDVDVEGLEEADEVANALIEDMEQVRDSILGAIENVEALDSAMDGMGDATLIDTDTLNEELKTSRAELDELVSAMSQPIPIGLDEAGLKEWQDNFAAMGASALQLQQKIKNTEKKIQEAQKAVAKFGEVQNKLKAASGALQEFGNATGLNFGPLEGAIGQLSTAIGFLPMVTKAASLGFTGMGKAAATGISTMTKAMMANPVGAALVALLAVLVAVQQAWSYFSKLQKEAQARMDETTAALNKQNRALELIAIKSEEDLRDKQLDSEKELQDLKQKHMRELAKAHMTMNDADLAALKERQAIEQQNLEAKKENKAAAAEVEGYINKKIEELSARQKAIEEEKLVYTEGRFENNAKVVTAEGEKEWGGIYDLKNQKNKESAEAQFKQEQQDRVHDVEKQKESLRSLFNDLQRENDSLEESLAKLSPEERKQFEETAKQTANSTAAQKELEGKAEKNQQRKVVRDRDWDAISTFHDSEGFELGVTDKEKSFKDAKEMAEAVLAEDKAKIDAELQKQIEDEKKKTEEGKKALQAIIDSNKRKSNVESIRQSNITRNQTLEKQSRDSLIKSSHEDNKERLADVQKLTAEELKRAEILRRMAKDDIMEEADTTKTNDELRQIKEKNELERQELEATYALDSKLEKGSFTLELKHIAEAAALEQNILDRNAKTARDLLQKQMGYERALRSSQRQAANRMLDRKLDLEIASGDTYGKSNAQIAYEKQEIENRYADEDAKQKVQDKALAKKQVVEAESLQMKDDALIAEEQKQFEDRQKKEMELLNAKAEKEKEWREKEFQARRVLIAQEIAYKAMLEKQAQERNSYDKQHGFTDTEQAKFQSYSEAANLTDEEQKEFDALKEKQKKWQEGRGELSKTQTTQREEQNQKDLKEVEQFDTSKERREYENDQKIKVDKFAAGQKRAMDDVDARESRRHETAMKNLDDEEDQELKGIERNGRKRDDELKREHARKERSIQRQIEEDNADHSDKQSARQLAQARDMALISAKTGRERMKALDEYARGVGLLNQKSRIAAETRERVDYAKKHGSNDAEINRIQKAGEDAIAEIESEAGILASIRDKQLSQGGGLRSVIGENTGQTSGLSETWERIQQSAFGHISDPAADAVIMMDRNEAVRNATTMNFYKEWFPKIAQKSGGLAAD